MAEPGGICVSKVVRDQVLDKLSFAFEDLGAQEVKNIARPVEVFRVDMGNRVAESAKPRGAGAALTQGRTWRPLAVGLLVLGLAGIAVWTLPRFWKEAPTASPPVLSVAVLPLAAPSGDADASRFSEAFTRHLLTSLPKKREYGRVTVVSAGSVASGATSAIDARELGHQFNVRYVLEGDVLRGGGANTVNLRLVDTATRAQVWAGRKTLQDTDIASESSVALRGVTDSLLRRSNRPRRNSASRLSPSRR